MGSFIRGHAKTSLPDTLLHMRSIAVSLLPFSNFYTYPFSFLPLHFPTDPFSNAPVLFFFFFFFLMLHASHYLPQPELAGSVSNGRNHKCRSIHISVPFSMSSVSLALTPSPLPHLVLQFFSDCVLVDSPGTASCHQYNDLKSFRFSGNDHFGITLDNAIGLYDCEDSSLCRADCEANVMPACGSRGNDGIGSSPVCCYPLSDGGVWQTGNGFSAFSQFRCRGFSCWLLLSGTNQGKRGVKLEKMDLTFQISNSRSFFSSDIITGMGEGMTSFSCFCFLPFDPLALLTKMPGHFMFEHP